MADNKLATMKPTKQAERRLRLQQMFDDALQQFVNYGDRVGQDFTHGLDQSAQGVADLVERGNVLTGIPRIALGGLGWMGSPVSAAVSPVLGPVLAPVAEATNTYVGQPVEAMTGYPADLTNELFLTGVTAGAGPVLKPALRGAGNFLARAGDAVEGAANRAGYTFRPDEGTLFSGAGPIKMSGMERRTAYHVAPPEHSGDLLSLYKQMGPDAYDEFMRRWPDADPAMGQYHAHQVHLYNTLEEAKKHTPQGKIYEVNLDDVEASLDALEPSLRHLVVQDKIPASALREVSGAGPVKLADDVAEGGQGANVDGMDTKLKPWRTPTMRDGIPSNLQKAYEAGIAVQRAADAEGSDVLSFLTDHSYNPRPGIPSIEDLAQINENPTMNAFYQAGNKGYAMPRLVTGQRYGDAPLAGASYNYREQTPELGVSMAKVDAQEFSDYQWADFFNKNRPIKSFEGWLLPKPMTGSDDEPLMVGLRKIANKNNGGGT